MRLYSLAYLTTYALSPPQAIDVAAKTGYAAAGLRLLPAAPGGAHWPLMNDAPMLRETLARVRDTSVRILDLEIVRIGDDFKLDDYDAFFDVGAALGARHVLVAGDDANEARLTEHYAQLCMRLQRDQLTADLEFMPWTAVKDVSAAARIVAAAQQPNAAVLCDALHFGRSTSTLAQVAALPRTQLNYAQICDGRVPPPATDEGLIFDARCERLLPGEGGIDIASLFRNLPSDIAVSVEVPSQSRAPQIGFEAWAAKALAASKRMLEAGG